MKEKIKTLLERRSIRNYQESQISDQELDTLLEAGKYAPSGMGEFKWKLVVFQRGGAMDEIIKSVKEEPFYGAPTLIAVFVDKDSHTPVQDGSLVIGNILNAAHMLGLGSCWINRMPSFFETADGQSIKNRLNIPAAYQCIGSCVIGNIKGEVPKAINRKDEMVIKADQILK